MRILIVEDDPELRSLLTSLLATRHPVDGVSDIISAEDHLDSYRYEVVLLDRNLAGDDIGLSLIASIKEKNPTTAVLVMSAYGTVEDKIDGLNLGADDYIEKPFDVGELLARINALGRRFAPTVLTFGAVTIDPSTRQITLHGEKINLTKKEDALLFYLISRMGQIASRDEIIDSIYEHPEDVASNTVDVMVNSLRKKLSPDIITTVKTRGYVIEHP